MNDDFKTQISHIFKSRRIPISEDAIVLLDRIIRAIHERIMMVISEMETFDIGIIIESIFPEDIGANIQRVQQNWNNMLHFKVPIYTELNIIYEYLVSDILDRTIYHETVTAKNIKSVFEYDSGLFKLLYKNRIILLDVEDDSIEDFSKGLQKYIKENPRAFKEFVLTTD